MTDIASLGVEINTGQVQTANKDLDFLAQIARNTAATVAALEKAAATTAAAIGKLSPAASEAATQIDAAATKTRTLAQAMVGFSDDLNTATRDVRDFASVGQRGLDQLRAKFDPLFAAGMRYKETLSDIRDAYVAGALTQTQYEAAIQRTKSTFATQTAILTGNKNAIDRVTGSGQLARHEMINLSRHYRTSAFPWCRVNRSSWLLRNRVPKSRISSGHPRPARLAAQSSKLGPVSRRS